MKEKLKFEIYKLENGEIEVSFDSKEDTFWLNQNQISEIFGVHRTVVGKHIKNIYKSGELDEKGTSAKNAQVQIEGKRSIKREIEIYNLDVILAVGYKVNSSKATEFRKWATKILKEHITNGFTINKNNFEKNYENFLIALEEIKNLSNGKEISSNEIINLIKNYAETWLNLDNFDKGNLPENGITKKEFILEIENLYKDIEILKSDLIKKGLATDFFAREKEIGNLKGIFGNIFATFDGKDLYETIEEKSANFLYFVIKNHPFVDGNKRTGAFCFIWFLQKYSINFQKYISPETLTTLTLFIAQSNPSEKEKTIGLILLLLKTGN